MVGTGSLACPHKTRCYIFCARGDIECLGGYWMVIVGGKTYFDKLTLIKVNSSLYEISIEDFHLKVNKNYPRLLHASELGTGK